MNNDRSSSGNSTTRNDEQARSSGYRGPRETTPDRDRAPPTIHSMLNPIDNTRTDRRLPSLHSVLNTPLRRETTSPERYTIASKSPKSDLQPRLTDGAPASHRPWEDPPQYPQRSTSPLLPPLRSLEARRYSQPAPNEGTWDPWTTPLSLSKTNPERGFSSDQGMHPPKVNALRSSQSGFPAFQGQTAAPIFYEDPRRDSARTQSNVSGAGASGTSLEVVGQAEIPGKGLCYVYQDGSICPTVIDDLPVNPAWGTTKAGKPRKRLAQACLCCREKKIRCEPRPNGCLQCDKAKRVCKMASQQQSDTSPEVLTPSYGINSIGGATGSGIYGGSGAGPDRRSSIAYGSTLHGLSSPASMPDFRARREF